jgi:hypothetical protein
MNQPDDPPGKFAWQLEVQPGRTWAVWFRQSGARSWERMATASTFKEAVQAMASAWRGGNFWVTYKAERPQGTGNGAD